MQNTKENQPIHKLQAEFIADIVKPLVKEISAQDLENRLYEMFEGYLENGSVDDGAYIRDMFFTLRQVIIAWKKVEEIVLPQTQA